MGPEVGLEGGGQGEASPKDTAAASAAQQGVRVCPVCRGTGKKTCGQCGGGGRNREDLFQGRFKKGDPCWLCSGSGLTMCGNCLDLTDEF